MLRATTATQFPPRLSDDMGPGHGSGAKEHAVTVSPTRFATGES